MTPARQLNNAPHDPAPAFYKRSNSWQDSSCLNRADLSPQFYVFPHGKYAPYDRIATARVGRLPHLPLRNARGFQCPEPDLCPQFSVRQFAPCAAKNMAPAQSLALFRRVRPRRSRAVACDGGPVFHSPGQARRSHPILHEFLNYRGD
jgi:hypothetical protein